MSRHREGPGRIEAHAASSPVALSAGERSRPRLLRRGLDDARVLLDPAGSEGDTETLAEVGSQIAVMTRSVRAWGLRELLSGADDPRGALIAVRGRSACSQVSRASTGWTDRYRSGRVQPDIVRVRGGHAGRGAHGRTEIPDEDLHVDFYRSAGPSCSGPKFALDGVRLTHLPTGVTGAGRDARTVQQNQAFALLVLASRLLARTGAREPVEANAAGRGTVRSYVSHHRPERRAAHLRERIVPRYGPSRVQVPSPP